MHFYDILVVYLEGEEILRSNFPNGIALRKIDRIDYGNHCINWRANSPSPGFLLLSQIFHCFSKGLSNLRQYFGGALVVVISIGNPLR